METEDWLTVRDVVVAAQVKLESNLVGIASVLGLGKFINLMPCPGLEMNDMVDVQKFSTKLGMSRVE